MAATHTDVGLAAIIQVGVYTDRFSTTSEERLIEAKSPDLVWTTPDEPELDDESLSRRLEIIRAETIGTAVRTRNFFIPWAVHNKRFAITSSSLLRICTTIGVPVLFLEGLLEYGYAIKPGNGLFFSRNETGGYSKLDLFYRCSSGFKGGRAYIFTTYDFVKKLTTNLCFNIQPDQVSLSKTPGMTLAQTSTKEPLDIHLLLAWHIIQSLSQEASGLRSHLLSDEQGEFSANPKARARNLHNLAQDINITVENFAEAEELIKFLIGASEKVRLAINPGSAVESTSEAEMLSYLLSKVQVSKRWVANYRDRTNIRINLAFHLSTQVDNDINLQISKSTKDIVRDSQRDSSSMITIAAVTMFFLPGTFMSAVFSMSFFNFQQDSTGNQQFQVSHKWWYFLASTIPLTVAVFSVWIVWSSWRSRRLVDEDKKGDEKLG